MRDIKFRGIPLYGENFVYGSLIIDINEKGEKVYIIRKIEKSKVSNFEVKEETVNQYTGKKDKNDVEIYEGDIVEAYLLNSPREDYIGLYISVFKDSCFMFKEIESDWIGTITNTKLEVTGNIYENPELLESKE